MPQPKFHIAIDNDGGEGGPWSVSIFPTTDSDERSGDLIAAGSGPTPQDALRDMCTDLERYTLGWPDSDDVEWARETLDHEGTDDQVWNLAVRRRTEADQERGGKHR